MKEIIVLAKLKFDLRNPDEAHFSKYEISSILEADVQPVKTIPALFKEHPFNKMDDRVIHIITRNLYLGEIQGYLAKVPFVNIENLILKPAFFREIYLISEGIINNLNNTHKNYEGLIKVEASSEELTVVRVFPIQSLFEYITDIKKLPDIAITPKNKKSWNEYFGELEKGIDKGLDEMSEHLRKGYFRAPHFGLGKKHIGDFIDWASTDLRKPFLHYLHKYKGKGDPRISRALINLLKVKRGDTILDPFVGSGSFILDAPTMGINAIGIEILEIGKIISEAKCNLNYDLKKLRTEVINLFSGINCDEFGLFSSKTDSEVKVIREKLYTNLQGAKTLANILPHLDNIISLKKRIEKVQDEAIRKFFTVLLSQKIVEFSEKKQSNNFISSFLTYLEDRYLTLYGTLKLAERLNINLSEGKVNIIKGDCTEMNFLKSNSIDGILTSPPYFDALDYIGNNKASIIILGFDDDLEIGSTDKYFKKFEDYKVDLPKSSKDLINLLKKSRRETKSQIVENYLKMMKLSFKECYRVLKTGGFYAMVISKFHSWSINGKEQVIETASIIADLGISEGFKLRDIIQHGLSKADQGKINVESILLFQK